MILADNITKYFGAFKAVDSVSFEIGRGEIVGFLGRNGAGKTTLMRMLTGYLPTSEGKVIIDGKDMSKNPLSIKRNIGYLPENPPLYSNMTVKDYLKFAARLKDITPKQILACVDRVIEECRLEDSRGKIISTLSKGYKQRVGIAQAIINEPEIIILDEPTSGLDPVQISHIRDLIGTLEHKRTVIVSTHILSEIEQIAKRVMIIKDGRIVKDDSLENILCSDNRKDIFIKVAGKEELIEKAIRQADGFKQINIDIVQDDVYLVQAENKNNILNYNDLLQKLVDNGAKVLEIKQKKGSLEEEFLRINRLKL